ncbi:MAG: LysR family transcriptional regulator [Flavitalea sp.]
MKYTLHQLQVFAQVVQTKSITRAAEELFLTQPAVSIQLKNFQDQFEVPLTEVVGRKLFITDFGKEVAEAAEKILNEVNAINQKTIEHKNRLSGRVKFSMVSTGNYVLPHFISPFRKANPHVDLTMDIANKGTVTSALENNEIDFALVSMIPGNLKLESVELLEDKLFLVANRDHKLKATIEPLNYIESLPLIHREGGSAIRQAIDQFAHDNNLKLQKFMEVSGNEAIKQAVIAGLGYSFLPLMSMKNELNNGELKIIPLEGLPLKFNWNLVWMKDKNLSPAAVALLDFIRKNKEKIVQEKFTWLKIY